MTQQDNDRRKNVQQPDTGGNYGGQGGGQGGYGNRRDDEPRVPPSPAQDDKNKSMVNEAAKSPSK